MPAAGSQASSQTDQASSGLGVLGYRLSLLARRSRAGFERRLADAGASFATWTVLETLIGHGPMIQRDLARSLEVTGQTMTRHIDRMVADGWLCRRQVEADRRAMLIEVTGAGHALHRQLGLVALEANAALIRGLSEQDLSDLERLLSILTLSLVEDLSVPAGDDGTP